MKRFLITVDGVTFIISESSLIVIFSGSVIVRIPSSGSCGFAIGSGLMKAPLRFGSFFFFLPCVNISSSSISLSRSLPCLCFALLESLFALCCLDCLTSDFIESIDIAGPLENPPPFPFLFLLSLFPPFLLSRFPFLLSLFPPFLLSRSSLFPPFLLSRSSLFPPFLLSRSSLFPPFLLSRFPLFLFSLLSLFVSFLVS